MMKMPGFTENSRAAVPAGFDLEEVPVHWGRPPHASHAVNRGRLSGDYGHERVLCLAFDLPRSPGTLEKTSTRGQTKGSVA